jgi:hypothetical protein
MMYWKTLLVNWNICRVVRLAAAIPILVMGIREHNWTTIVFGAIFAALGLFSTQCCTTSGTCYSNSSVRSNRRREQQVEFEEIK